MRAAQLLTRAAQLLQQHAARKQQQHAAHHYARLWPTTTRAQQPTLKPRGPAAQRVALAAPPPRPGRNLGLGWDSSCPPWLYSARSNGRRQSESDGQASISEDQNPHWPWLPSTLASFFPSLSLSSAPSVASSRARRPEEEVEVVAPPRPLSPARACG